MPRCIAAVGVIAGLIVGLIVADPAAALAPGVVIDPNSPAGKESAYPLAVLRADGAGQLPDPSRGAAAGPLFGVGVTARGAVNRGSKSEPAFALIASRSSSLQATALIAMLVLVLVLVVGLALGAAVSRLGRRT